MAIISATADDEGAIYAITDDGTLLFYRDLARDGTPRFENSGVGRVIGSDWGNFVHVFSGGDGVLYAVARDGGLLYFRDLGRDGSASWATGSGQRIGSDWGSFSKVFSGGDGVIYAVDPSGDLRFYRDQSRSGAAKWARRSGNVIGSDWGGFQHVVGGANGVIYAVDADGTLLFFRDRARNGTAKWENGGVGRAIGDGWANFVTVFSGGDGILYAITPDGFLLFYRDLAQDGTSNWSLGGAAATLGSGWQAGPAAPVTIEGYATPLSVAPGQTMEFMVSSEAPYEVTYLRLGGRPNGDLGTLLLGPEAHPAGRQPVPSNAWEGLEWTSSFSLQIPDSWRSGLHAACCTNAAGESAFIVFVVKPPENERGDIAVLANTLTWNAYNDWGGRSKYTTPPGAKLSFRRPNPYVTPAATGPIDHLGRAESWVHDWLEAAGYRYDLYADADLDGGPILEGYRALVISTHPEYWTAAMMERLRAFIAGGGSLLYLGGNGLFEQVELIDDGAAIRIFGGDPTAARDRFYFRNLEPPIPEREVLGVAYRFDNYMTFAPYEVLDADHRFFAGTGLANGDHIGPTGRNGGGASGWEMDTSLPGNARPGAVVSANGDDDRGSPPSGTVLLARGANPGFGADMTCYETPAGGIVFSVGSISFGGSLIDDPQLQQILKNILDEILA